MSQLGTTITVKKCRRDHRCWYCAEVIERGSSYVKWTWEDSGDLTTIKCHPECRDAWHDWSAEEGYPVEIMFGEGERPRVETAEETT